MARNQNDEVITLDSNGTMKIDDNMFESNGTNTVTISNVAPSLVGTPTISKWLKFRDDTGTTYFIPAWT